MSQPQQPSATSTLTRGCDHPDCTSEGLYRAPRSRDQLNQYYWFCKDHVRQYNRAWDFYKGMPQHSIEASIRADATWQRPSWPFGLSVGLKTIHTMASSLSAREWLQMIFEGQKPREHKPRTSDHTMNTLEQKAIACLELSPPFTWENLKRQYKSLVKKHHPDAHNGCKHAEERLKTINEAYGILRKYLHKAGDQKL